MYNLEAKMKGDERMLPRKLLWAICIVVFLLWGTFAGAEADRDGNLPPSLHESGRGATINRVPKGDRHAPDELLVKFRAGVKDEDARGLHGKAGASLLRHHKRLRLHHVKLPPGLSVADATRKYKASPLVEYAEPNFYLHIQNTPNDPSFSQLWGIHNTSGSKPDADIDGPEAWDLSTGSKSVVVAVIDTGVDYNHQDLAPNMWMNPGEIPGNGIDDDGNGYVDDVYGIDAYNHDTNPFDDHFHGTHVAGTIGAAGNNGIGVVGVNWEVSIVACKFIGAGGSGSTAGAIECLEYIRDLKDRGVNIVASNNSWGGGGDSVALRDAIAAQGDMLFIAAAGNESSNNDKVPFYPAVYDLPNMVSVAATDNGDNRASYSNFGSRTVHIGAPGHSIYSTFPNSQYQMASGTSMAAPHAAGVAALLKAQDPNRDWRTIRNLLLAGGDPIASLSDITITGRRLNAYGAMTCENRPLLVALQPPNAPAVGIPLNISVLSINCGLPVGPVTVSVSNGSPVNLNDNGVAPDLAAGDGIFTGTWVPAVPGSTIITYTSPNGTLSVASPPLMLGNQMTVIPPAVIVDTATVSATQGENFTLTFQATGGISPYAWSLSSGSLPPGLSLNSQTGEITGVSTAAGLYPFTLKVTDAIGMKDWLNGCIFVNSELRPGWPKVLEKRIGTGFMPYSMPPVIADLDGDGTQEIIVVDRANSKDTLYVFNADGLLVKTALPGQGSVPAVADLDGDGYKEIIVSVGYYYTNANPIYAFRRDLTLLPGFPAGSYQTYYPDAPGNCRTPVLADLDHDGTLEIIVNCTPNNIYDPNFNSNVLLVVDSHGNILSGWPKIIPGENGNEHLPAIGDLDGDGKDEIVLATKDGMIFILRKDGSEVARWSFAQGAGNYVDPPVIADMDGNGTMDIVLKYSITDPVTNASTIWMAVYTSNGALLPGWPLSFAGYSTAAPTVADLDSDGKPEIMFYSGLGARDFQAFRGDGTSLPGWPYNKEYDEVMYGVLDGHAAVADVNGDGMMEMVVSVSTFSNGKAAYGVQAISANGQRLAGYPKFTTPLNELRSMPALGDLDNNGRLDMVVKSEDGMLYAFEASAAAPAIMKEWPMYRHDPQTSGRRTVPTVAITSPQAGMYYSSILLLLDFAPSGSGTLVRLDGLPIPTSSGASIGPLADGTHDIRVEITDADGYRGVARSAFMVDTLPPMLVSTDPVNSSRGVSVSKTIAVNFSEPVQAGNAYGSITLKKGKTLVSIVTSISGNTLFIDPNASLATNSTYTVTIPVNVVKDLVGNTLATGTTFSFTTSR